MSPLGELHAEALNRDAAALIALWLQIYGGDPPPQEVQVSPVTGILVAGVVAQLRHEFKAAAPLTHAELAGQLARLGLQLGDAQEHARSEVLTHGRFTCVRGPDGAPGCCVGVPVHLAFEE